MCGGIYCTTSSPTIEYCDFYGNSSTNYAGTTLPAGLGTLTTTNYNGDDCDIYSNIFLNPQFVSAAVGNFNLQTWSACLDAGDPELPLDPDGSYAEIGAFTCIPGPPPSVLISLAPEGTPISIPASGGSFDFNIAVENLETTTATFDVWTDVTLPDGSIYGPIINVQNLSLPGNATIDRDRTQAVPSSAPDGSYFYNAYAGNYPNTVYSEDNFSFVKECTDGIPSEPVLRWNSWGEGFEEISCGAENVLSEYSLLSAYPNPFNPQTTISLNLPVNSEITLTVYDVQGRETSRLMEGWYSAGFYEVTMDGADLSSGTYFVQAVTESQRETMKVLLVK